MHQAAGAIESTQREREDKAIDYVFKLLDIPWWCYAIATLIGIVVWKTWRWEGGILSAYTFLVLAETIFIRQPFIGQHFQPQLFWSWRVWAVQKEQILTNVIMFVPIGVLAGLILRWKGLWVATGLSLGIEILQLVTSKGLCEFDDVIHNMMGAVIGIGIVMIGNIFVRKEDCKW